MIFMRRIAVMLLLIGILGWIAILATRQLVPPRFKPVFSLTCASAGGGGQPRRILVYGESWAAGGRLLPELAQHAAKRLGQPVRVCQLGARGANSALLLRYDPVRLALAELGGRPHHFILLNGVNDQKQHRGARAYARDTEELLSRVLPANGQAVVIPFTRSSSAIAPFRSLRLKLIAWWNGERRDLFSAETNADYERAARALLRPRQVISFRPFSSGPAKDPLSYAPDGYHLTLARFHQYGAYLGDSITP